MEVTVKFYYIRDSNNLPRVTVCLLKLGDEIARGISICSLKEQPVVKTGRHKAYGRAMRAITHKDMASLKGHPEVMRNDAADALMTVALQKNVHMNQGLMNGPYIMKWEYNPKLTEYEKELLFSRPEEKAA